MAMTKIMTYGKWLFASVIVLASAFLLLRFAIKRPQIDDVDAQIYHACRTGDFTTACRIIEQAITRMPAERSYQLRYSLVQIYLQQKSYDQAEHHLQICLRQVGPAAPLQIIRAKIWHALGRQSQARQSLLQLIKQEPEFLAARMELVEQALANGDLVLAAEQLKGLGQKIDRNYWQNFPDVYRLQARLSQLRGDFTSAQSQLNQFLALRPHLIQAHRHRIELMPALGQLSQARQLYRSLAHRTTGQAQTIYQQLYATLLPPRTAIDYLQKLAASKPDLSLRLSLCSFLLKEGEYVAASKIIKTLKTDDIFIHAKLLGWQGYAQVMGGQRQAGEKTLQRLLQQDHGRYYGLLGLVYSWLAQKEYARAIATWQKIMPLLPEKGNDLQLLRVKIAYESGDFKMAVHLARQMAIATPPGCLDHSRAMTILGKSLLADGRYSEATTTFASLAKQEYVPSEMRLRAALWHGVAVAYGQGDPCSLWRKYLAFPWKNYLVDDRELLLLQLVSDSTEPKLAQLYDIPFLANDICFLVGLWHRLHGRLPQALASYTQGLKLSQGQEFPWHELDKARLAIEKLRSEPR